MLHRSVGDANRLLDGGELAGVLDLAQPLDEPARGRPLDPGGGLLPLLVGFDGDVVALDPHPPGAHLLQPLGEHRLDAIGHLGEGEIGRLLAHLLIVAKVGGQEGLVLGDDQHPGRPGEPAEVAAVLGLGDEKGVESPLGDQPSQAIHALVHRCCSYALQDLDTVRNVRLPEGPHRPAL